jgi:hypothetical protein
VPGYALIAPLLLLGGVSLVVVTLCAARRSQPSGSPIALARVGLIWVCLIAGSIMALSGIAMSIPPI